MNGVQCSAKIVSLTRALGTTRPNVFRSSASLTGVVSRSKQIAGTFELIYRLCVWKSLTKLVMTIILLQEENIEFVQKVISISFFFFFYLSVLLFVYAVDVIKFHKFAHKYINELFVPKQKH